LIAMLVAGAPSVGDAGILTPEAADALERLAPEQTLDIIAHFSGRADLRIAESTPLRERAATVVRRLRAQDLASRAALRQFMENRGADTRDLLIINAVAVRRAPAALVPLLAEFPGVERVEVDATFEIPDSPAAAGAAPEWNLLLVRAPELWSLGYTGEDVVVATLDTGVDSLHPDLGGRWRGGSNSWFDPYGQQPLPADTDGHGTRTMGVIVGGDSGGTAIGVAPGAQWIAARIFDNQGVAQLSAVHAAFQWLLDPDGDPATDDAPEVVNNSWMLTGSEGQCVSEFQPDLDALRAAGMIVVFAAGNSGPDPDTSTAPANNLGAVAVGAVDASLAIARFSSRGPSGCPSESFPTVVAPGVDVVSTDLSYGGMALYSTHSGTSLAAPHVSGVAALLLSAFPDLSPEQVDHALARGAQDLGAAEADDDYGAGVVDAVAAYDQALCVAGADGDGDGFADVCDNCFEAVNPDQRDTNDDGYGNVCDADLNDDLIVNLADLSILRQHYGAASGDPNFDSDSDLNGDGIINLGDLAILRAYYGGAPGPSGTAP